jgi:hypothetical protein
MSRKSASSRTMAVDKMTAEQAANASTNIKITTTRINEPRMANPKTLGNESLNDLFEEQEDTKDNDMGRRIYEVDGIRYRIRQCNPYALWEVISDKGGPVPQEIRGKFTNPQELQKALDILQAHRSAKGVINKRHREKLAETGFFDNKEEPAIEE